VPTAIRLVCVNTGSLRVLNTVPFLYVKRMPRYLLTITGIGLLCWLQLGSVCGWYHQRYIPVPPSASSKTTKPIAASSISKCIVSVIVGLSVFGAPVVCEAAGLSQSILGQKQSPGWELVRKKRTQAIKDMESRGIVKVQTDDVGNQFLSVPWLPDKKVPYKSLPLSSRYSLHYTLK
jgi:hypothetical protein